MKSFINKSFEALAFDLDGTLYDEYDFIRQAYRPVSEVLSSESDPAKMYRTLCRLWLIHGSSANIFQLAYEEENDAVLSGEMLKRCIEAFRNARFELDLRQRTADLLDLFGSYPKVIITDGNSQLQRKKIDALGLAKWFKEDDIFVSSDYGKQAYKPDPYMADLVKEKLHTKKILYFGDREIDEEFSKNAGFGFCHVKDMIIV
ncbi:MAG: HAD family hydrolase [Erysipelotrichaceae bacterium]|nr:HAD family hydrolase [Erysipelotrichaceae bacterium]